MYLIDEYRDWLADQPEAVIVREFQRSQVQVKTLEREQAEDDPRASVMLNVWQKRLEAQRDALTQQRVKLAQEKTACIVAAIQTSASSSGFSDDCPEQSPLLSNRSETFLLDPRTLKVMAGRMMGKGVAEVTDEAFRRLEPGQTLAFSVEPTRRIWWLMFREAQPFKVKVSSRVKGKDARILQ